MIGWTNERVDHLRYLWSSGLSAAECARELGGVSRNAVIGKITRLGISEREKGEINRPKRSTKVAARKEIPPLPAPAPAPGSRWTPEEITRMRELRASGMIVVDIAMALGRPFEATKKKLKEAGIRVDEPKRAERTARPFVAQVIERPDNLVSIMELGPMSCRWPFSTPGTAEFGYCGERVDRPGVPYCCTHFRAAYVPMSHGKRSAA